MKELYQFCEIESIEECEETSDVYDIEVEDVHNFFANDILVHNCLAGIPTWCSLQARDASIDKVFELYDKELFPLMQVFGKERFFLELQFNKIPEQQIVNSHLVEYSKKTGYDLIATADCHYPSPDMFRDREIYRLLGYQMQNREIDMSILDKSADELECELYLKNGDQLFKAYKESPFGQGFGDDKLIVDAIQRTYGIAHDLIGEVAPDDSIKLPKTFQVTDTIKTPFDKLKALSLEGLKKKGLTGEVYIKRAAYELKIIREKKLEEYFLTLKEVLDVLRQHMLLGTGRGSGAGSLINYLLDITIVDPVKEGLLFERFISPSRIEMADVDTDVELKDQALDILKAHFGADNVLAVSNYNTLQLKSLVKDISKLYGIPFDEVNEVTKIMESEAKPFILEEIGHDQKLYEFTYEKARKYSPTFEEFIEKYPKVGERIDNLFKEVKSIGRHAGGVLVIPDAEGCLPIIRIRGVDQSPIVEGLTAQHLKYFGLVKYDILGLATLRIIRRCIEIILRSERNIQEPSIGDVWQFYNSHLHPSVIDTADPKVFKSVYRSGRFPSIFQFAEENVQNFCVRAAPESVADISAITALWRPGPLKGGADIRYLGAKDKGLDKNEHPIVLEILGDTKGLLCIEKGQKVSLSNGSFKNIEDIREGDEVITGEGNISFVTKVINKGKKDTCTYYTDGIESKNYIKCTPDHKVRTVFGYKEASKSDHLLYHRFKRENISEKIENPYLLGLFVSDGCCNQSSPAITCGTENVAKIVSQELEKTFGTSKYYFHCRAFYATAPRKEGEYRSALINWLKKYDLFRQSGENKSTPRQIFASSDEDIAKYLAGYLDGDGRVSEDVFSFSCAYVQSRIKLCKLLDILKISYYISHHSIVIRDNALFRDLVYVHCKIKSGINVKNNICGEIFLDKQHRKFIIDKSRKNVSIKKFLKSLRIAPSLYWKSSGNIKIETLLRILSEEERKEFIKTYLRGDFSIQAIKRIEKNGNKNVFDLSINHSDHSFLVGGYAVHNCYQEQFMLLANKLADFSLGEADQLRKLLVKPSHELGEQMKKQRIEVGEKFVNGCIAKGLSPERAKKLWEQEILGFISYGFNKSHSVCYAYNSYQCAWLYTYYPDAWVRACLECDPDLDKTISSVSSVGYKIAKPDVNASFGEEWYVHDKVCYPAMTAVKGIGVTAAQELVRKRTKPFSDLEDFFYELDAKGKKVWRWSKFNKKAIDALIRVEAFESFGCVGEGKLFRNYRHMYDVVIGNFEKIKKGKVSLQELASQSKVDDWSISEKIEMQKEILGFYNKASVIEEYRSVLNEFDIKAIDRVPDEDHKHNVWAIIENVEQKFTNAAKKPYLVITASGESSQQYKFRVWNTNKEKTTTWREGSVVLFSLEYDDQYGYSLPQFSKAMRIEK